MTTHELALILLKMKNIPVGIEGSRLSGIPEYIDIISVTPYKLYSLKEDGTENEYELNEFAAIEL